MYDEKKDEEKKARIELSYCLLKSPMSLMAAMYCVIDDWKIEAEQYMSHVSSNRQAWLGQAACCYALKAPDYITKKAWWSLPKQIRDRADKNASGIIDSYEKGTWNKRFESSIPENQLYF